MAARPGGRSSRGTSRCSTSASPRRTRTSRPRSWRVLAEYDIGYIKWDHNRDLVEAGTQPTAAGPASTPRRWRSTACSTSCAPRIPELEIESCSSGGARVDLGVLERTDRVWVSDCIDPLERQQMLRWTAPADAAGVAGLAHRLRPLAHHRAHARPRRSAPAPRSSATSASSGTSREADEPEMAELEAWIGVLQGPARAPAGRGPRADGRGRRPASTCTGWSRRTGRGRSSRSRRPTASTRIRRPGCGSAASTRSGVYRVRPVVVGAAPSGLKPPRWWGGPGFPGAVFTGAALEHVGVAAPIVHPDQVVLLRMDEERHSV